MHQSDRKGLHFMQYGLVILFMGALTLLERTLPFLRHDLIGAPYLIILTVAALFGDYISGILAIVLGVFCIGFLSLNIKSIDLIAFRRSIEFLVGGIIIYVLSYRSRKLVLSQVNLEDSVNQLKLLTEHLNKDVKNKKQNLDKLNKINHDLRNIISEIMDDEDLWRTNIEHKMDKS